MAGLPVSAYLWAAGLRGLATSAPGASRSGRSAEPRPSLEGAWPSPPLVPGTGHLRSIEPCGRPWCWSARSAADTNGPGSAERCPGAAATSMDRPQRAPKVATRAVPRAGAASSASPVSAARSVTPLTWSRSSFQAARAPSPGEDIRHPDGVPRHPGRDFTTGSKASSPEERPRHPVSTQLTK
jgi:hypothetical protein